MTIARRSLLILAAVLAAGALLRAAYLAEISPRGDFLHPAVDALYHDHWARGLATGDWTPPPGFADPRIRSTPYLRPPGYPWFLALTYKMGNSSPWSPRLFQAGLGLLSGVLLFLLSRRIFGEEAGLLAAGLFTATWVVIYHEGELLEPSPVTFLTLLLLLLAAGWSDRPSAWRAMGIGFTTGACALFRPNALLFLPLLLAWGAWVLRRRGETRGGVAAACLLLAGMAAAVLPVTARNGAVADDPVLISSNGGVNLYIGNNPSARGVVEGRIEGLGSFLTSFDYGKLSAAVEREAGRPLSASEVSSWFSGKAWAWMASHPGQALALWGRKTLLFWGPKEVSHNKEDELERADSRVLRLLPGWPLALGLALPGAALFLLPRKRGGLPLAPRQREAGALVLALALAWFASYLPFFVAGRYRVPVLPLLWVFAAAVLVHVAGLARERRWGPAGAWAGTALLSLGLAFLNPAGYRPDPGKWHYQRGIAEAQAGNLDAAERRLQAALEAAPERPESYDDLGIVYARRGEEEKARAVWELGAKADPSYPYHHAYLGKLAFQEARFDDAVRHLKTSLRLGADAAWIGPMIEEALAALPGK